MGADPVCAHRMVTACFFGDEEPVPVPTMVKQVYCSANVAGMGAVRAEVIEHATAHGYVVRITSCRHDDGLEWEVTAYVVRPVADTYEAFRTTFPTAILAMAKKHAAGRDGDVAKYLTRLLRTDLSAEGYELPASPPPKRNGPRKRHTP